MNEFADEPRGCAIAVMAKAPRPGAVKTRLIPPLSPEAAKELGAAFLRDITDNLALAARDAAITGYVAYAPKGYENLFDGLLAPGTRLLLADGAGEMPADVAGFGRSLLHAARALFDLGHPSACLLNADSPTLRTSLLSDAARLLAAPGERVVLGPADDGGYYLIGMQCPHAGLFADIDWSTERVADQTRQRARTLGLELVELPRWYDVDDAASLDRLIGELAAYSAKHSANIASPIYHAPRTAECLRRLTINLGSI